MWTLESQLRASLLLFFLSPVSSQLFSLNDPVKDNLHSILVSNPGSELFRLRALSNASFDHTFKDTHTHCLRILRSESDLVRFSCKAKFFFIRHSQINATSQLLKICTSEITREPYQASFQSAHFQRVNRSE